MDIELKLQNYEELKKVENFLFRFIYPEDFTLQIIIEDSATYNEYFNYTTKYSDLAQGLILETF